MAQNTTIGVGATWVQLTNGDATSVTVQNLGLVDLLVTATADDSIPSVADTAVLALSPGDYMLSTDLTIMFPGVTNPKRLWGKARDKAGTIASASHA